MAVYWQRNIEKDLAQQVDEHASVISRFPIQAPRLDEIAAPDAVAKHIYEALAAQGITYVSHSGEFSQSQKILTPDEILAGKKGNCLDLSAMFAALALHHGLFCGLVVFADHAMVLVDRTAMSNGQPKAARPDQQQLFSNAGLLTSPLSDLKEFIRREAFLPIECTGFSSAKRDEKGRSEWRGRGEDGRMTFERAVQAGHEQLQSSRTFSFALDLALAREAGIRPSQTLSGTDAGEIVPKQEQEAFIELVGAWLEMLEFQLPPGWPGTHQMTVDLSRPARDRFDRNLRMRLKIETGIIPSANDVSTWWSANRAEADVLAFASLQGFASETNDLHLGDSLHLLTPENIDVTMKLRPILHRLLTEYESVDGTPTLLIPHGAPLKQQFRLRRGFTRIENGYDVISIPGSVPHQPAPNSMPGITDYPTTGQWVDEQLADDTCRLMVLVGDSRHGKTSLLVNLWYQLAQRYLHGVFGDPYADRLPLYFHIRNLAGKNLFAFMTDTLSTYDVEYEPKWLRHLHEEGRLLLLLDGFDEAEPNLGENYEQIMPATGFRRCKIILSTARGAFAEAHNASIPSFGSYDKPGKPRIARILELRPYRMEEVEEVAAKTIPEGKDDFMSAVLAHPDPKDVIWPGNLEQQLQGWKRGERTIQPIAQALEKSALAATTQGGWQPELKRAFLRRLAHRVSTKPGARPLALSLADADSELALLPGLETADDAKRQALLTALPDNIYIAKTVHGELEWLERYWVDYFHAEYLVELTGRAAKFEDLPKPPMNLSEVAEFTRSLITHRPSLQSRIAPLIPRQGGRDVDKWLFWRELMQPETLQGEFEEEDARRVEGQKKLTENHGGALKRIAAEGIEAVIIPGARFIRGGWEIAPKHIRPQLVRPPRIIRVSPFILATRLVTNREFQAFVDATGHVTAAEWGRATKIIGPNDRFEPAPKASWRDPRASGRNTANERLDHPVVQIAREDAMAYCNWLARRLGYGVELPTEAQWELAARGSLARLYPWGNLPWNNSLANCAALHVASPTDEALKTWWAEEKATPPTTEVGSFEPNALGLYDLAGNVWEWTADWYAVDFYENSPEDDPKLEEGEFQIVRGGGWDDLPRTMRCYWRYPAHPGESSDNIGFRLAFPLDDLGSSKPLEPEASA